MDLFRDLQTDQELHRNLLKFATMLTVSKAISLQDAQFMINTIATLVGVTAYHLITKKITLPVKNPDLKRITNTWMKLGTILSISQLYKGNTFSQSFLKESAITILSFNITDILIPRLIPTFESTLINSIVSDIAIVLTTLIGKNLLLGNNISSKLFIQAGWTLSGFILYDLIISLAC